MAEFTQIQITFTGVVPLQAFAGFGYTLYNTFGVNTTGFVYSQSVPSKIALNQMTLGTSAADTAQKFADSIIADNAFLTTDNTTVSGNVVTVKLPKFPFFYYEFYPPGIFAPFANHENVLIDTDDEVIVPDPPLQIYAPNFEVDFFRIDIVDTQLEHVLENNFTQFKNPVLQYSDADSLLEAFRTSKLTFNMLVSDKSDAFFKALYTGEENRYLVQLKAVYNLVTETEETEVENLIWQGFLLPDLYKEPYTNNVLWVDFEATDMIASLKNKSLKPWMYNNRFPLTELLALILQQTSLFQPLYIQPSILHSYEDYAAINLDINTYSDKTLYELLEDICKSMCMTLYNYNGKWFFVGFDRWKELDAPVLVFDIYGKYDSTKRWIKTNHFFDFDNTPLVGIVSPYQEINVEYDGEKSNNIFSDKVLKAPEIYALIDQTFFANGLSMFDTYSEKWKLINGQNIISFTNVVYAFSIQRPIFAINYAVNESQALVNYVETSENVFLTGQTYYEFDMQFTIAVNFNITEQQIKDKLNQGLLDKLVNFQLLVGNNIIGEKRPSVNDFDYERSLNINNVLAEITFKIKKEIFISQSGKLVFRLLAPIANNTDFNINFVYFINAFANPMILKVTQKDRKKDLKATRNIKYSTSLNYGIEIISDAAENFQNNFGIGVPVSENYVSDITIIPPVERNAIVGNINNFNWKNAKYVCFSNDAALSVRLFEFGKKTNLFVNKKLSFTSVYSFNNLSQTQTYISYITELAEFAVVPDGYKPEPILNPATDTLQLFDIKYNPEDKTKRNQWRLPHQQPFEFQSFMQTIAQLIHNLYSAPAYQIEGTARGLCYPGEVITFAFDGQDRMFIPTGGTLNLNDGKTALVAVENVYNTETLVSYE